MNSRWYALTVVFLGFVQFTLNWFIIVPGFGPIARELHLGFSQVALLLAFFLLGYGVFHLPTGALSARYGALRIAWLGVALQGAAGIGSALAVNFPLLTATRFVSGMGAALFVGASIGIVTAWFKDRELSVATGISTGVGFEVGGALGIFLGTPLVAALGWRATLVIGGVYALVMAAVMIATLHVPPGAETELGAHTVTGGSVMRVLRSRTCWIYGIAILGAYGAFFTQAQFLPQFVERNLGFTPQLAAALAAGGTMFGIPGAVLGGWVCDRTGLFKTVFLGAFAVGACGYALLTLANPSNIWFVAIFIHFVSSFGLTPWFSVPGRYAREIRLEDVPTAAGLLLTMAAIGGFAVPAIFGRIVGSSGFNSGWMFLFVVSIVFLAVGLLAARPDPVRRTDALIAAGASVTP
jgi:ACS family D-galactonate transporter-like MFS transporter